jgi:hypothetical protein
VSRFYRLAGRAEPRASTGHTRAGDRRSAAVARLSAPAVDAKLVLHRAAAAVGEAVVPERGPLAREALLERCPYPPVQALQLGALEAGRRAQRIEPRPPQRLVCVDVPQPGQCPLVEQRRLQGRAPARKALAESGGREERVERLVADARCEIRLRLSRLEQKPGAEPAHVSIRNVRSVV